MTKMLLGQPLADKIYRRIADQVTRMKRNGQIVSIVAISVGFNPASETYLRIKAKRCAELGIDFSVIKFESNVNEKLVIEKINELNRDEKVTGIIVQLPLPDSINRDNLLYAIDKNKDIDAFSYLSSSNTTKVFPPTPFGMLELLDFYNISLKDKKIAVVGDGVLVGLPLTKILREKKYFVELVSDSASLQGKLAIKAADVIFCGVGKACLINSKMIKKGAVIVDAGFTKVNDKICGDADPKCAGLASAMTPPVGGVGPLTVAYLLQNAVTLAEKYLDNF